MAKSVYNPSEGADIVDRNINGTLYTLKVGETVSVDDAVAEELAKVYGFLKVSDPLEVVREAAKEEAPAVVAEEVVPTRRSKRSKRE